MPQVLQKLLIIDSSSLIALERGGFLDKLESLDAKILIPPSVSVEVGGDKLKILRNLEIVSLSGKSLKLARDMVLAGFGKGESECLALANRLKTGFIVSDDRKLIRQKFLSRNRLLGKTAILGFSSLLHLLKSKGLLINIWDAFEIIIEKNNWQRSEVEAANYTFLKELGY